MSSHLEEHRHYLSDAARTEAYRQAIRELVRPGAVVLDLGAGTGIFGLMSCRVGASRVYAVDRSGMIEIARRICSANTAPEEIVFINQDSRDVTLPERVDVVVADQIGGFGFEAGLLECFDDARRRLLKPGGLLIPARVDLWIAPVESVEARNKVDFWNGEAAGYKMSAAFPWAANTPYPVTLRREDLLAEPALAASLDLTRDSRPSYKFEATVKVSRAGELHGLGGWFSAFLSPNVVTSNSPLTSPRIARANVYYPAHTPSVVVEGDELTIGLTIRPHARLVSWRVALKSKRPSLREEPIQSTWHGDILSREQLHRSNPAYRPRLSPFAEARLSTLSLCNGQRSLEEIEAEVYRSHGSLFRSLDEVARFVYRTLEEASR